MSNRWLEYNNKTLITPAVVQHDEVCGMHLVWVATGEKIEGPISVKNYDEAAVIATAMTVKNAPDMAAQDGSITEEQAQKIATLTQEKTALQKQVSTLTAKVATLEAAKVVVK